MFNTVESLDTLPKLLHFFHTLEQLGFFYLEARCFVRGFVYLLDIPKFLDGIFLVLLGNIIPVLGKRGHTAIQSALVSDYSGYTYCACHGSGMGSFSAVHTLTGAWPRAAIIHISSVPVFII